MTPGERAAEAAMALIGVRFRLHGRDPAFGLDCVGLAAAALGSDRLGPVATGYGLRSGDRGKAEAALMRAGLKRVEVPASGDVLVAMAGPG